MNIPLFFKKVLLGPFSPSPAQSPTPELFEKSAGRRNGQSSDSTSSTSGCLPGKRAHGHIEDLPDFHITSTDQGVETETHVSPGSSFAESRTQIAMPWSGVGEPSYHVVAAKSAAMKESGDRPRGASWEIMGSNADLQFTPTLKFG